MQNAKLIGTMKALKEDTDAYSRAQGIMVTLQTAKPGELDLDLPKNTCIKVLEHIQNI